MNKNNVDMAKLMAMLSTMDKADLDKGLKQLNQVLNSKDKDKIIDNLKNNLNNNQ